MIAVATVWVGSAARPLNETACSLMISAWPGSTVMFTRTGTRILVTPAGMVTNPQ